MTPTEHGYGSYSRGCRCDICREAKATRTREYRARRWRTLRLVQQTGIGRNFVEGITHGYSGYQNYACRCVTCTAAKHASDMARTTVSPSGSGTPPS